MGWALMAEVLGFLIIAMMFSYRETKRETFTQWLMRSVRIWLSIALFGKGVVKGRHSLEWRYPSGRQHQVRAINA